MKKLSTFLVSMLAPICLLLSQEFTCDGTFYISINQSGPPTTFYEITTAGGVNFMPLFDVNFNMNGTGLSTVDKNVYGVAFNTNEVFRVEANGTVTSVFSEPDIVNWNAAAGAVNNNGVYVVHDRNLDMVFLYQTGATVTKLGSVALFWDSSTGNSGIFDHDIDDLVFDPFDDGVMYTYQRFGSGPMGTRGHLLKVDVDMTSPDFGMVSSVGQLDPSVIIHLGSLFFDTNGALHGYGAQTASPFVQDRLVKINQNNATITEIGIGPPATGVDGCSCRNPLKLDKIVQKIESTCDSNFISYRIEIENLSMLETVDLKLKDSLSFDGTITSMDFVDFPVSAVSSGGVGSDIFIFDNFNIPGSDRVGLEFTVATALQNTLVENQARLYEIGIGSPILSDDPSTMEISDPTEAFLPIINGVDSTLMISSLCFGDSLVVNGNVYYDPGTYEEYFVNGMGCDSVLTIILSVFDHTSELITAEICEGETITINGQVYDTPGTYDTLLMNNNGCDSLLTIELVLVDQENGFFNTAICPDEAVFINGELFTEPGTYFQTIPGQFCDSIVTITIVGLSDTTRTELIELCPGEDIVFNGETFSETGVYVQEFENSVGCDSILLIDILALNVCDDCIPENPNIILDDIVLYKKSTGLFDIRFTIDSKSLYIYDMKESKCKEVINAIFLAEDNILLNRLRSENHGSTLGPDFFENIGQVRSDDSAYQRKAYSLHSILEHMNKQSPGSAMRLKR